ncbi:MAG: hypothetical protein JEZ05_06060 [Tenericutes bacterium]|nr:hypothetical protein [Mycoplasmatota bacterium]
MLYKALATIVTYNLTIIDDVLAYVNSGFSWIETQATWMQLVIYAVAIIFILVGLFTFLKKFIKAFLVIAILGGIVYVLDMQGIISIQGIIDQVTGLLGVIFKTIL